MRAHRTVSKGRPNRPSSPRIVAALGLVYQVVYAAAQLVSLGLIARHFSLDEYGLWMTVLAVTTWIPIAALGQNAVVLSTVGAHSGVDERMAQSAFQASFVIVAGVTVALALFLMLFGGELPWVSILNIQLQGSQVSPTEVAWAACFVSLAALPLVQIGYSVYASQRGDLTHTAMIAGSLILLVGTTISIDLGWPLWIVGALSLAGPVLGGLLLLVRCADGTILRLKGEWRLREIPIATALQAGLQFVVIDGLSLLVVRTPDLIVAHLHGVAAVPAFASVGRLAVLSLALYQAVLFSVWPAIAQAQKLGRPDEVRFLLRRSFGMVLAMWSVFALGVLVGGRWFIEVWLGRSDMAPDVLLWASIAQAMGLALMSWLTVMLSALSRRALLIKALGAIALVYLALALVFGNVMGSVGVAVAQAVGTIFVVSAIIWASSRSSGNWVRTEGSNG